MGACMDKRKINKVGELFRESLGEGWTFYRDLNGNYGYGAVIAGWRTLKVVMDIKFAPLLLFSLNGRREESVIKFPNIEALRLARLMARTANVQRLLLEEREDDIRREESNA